MKYPGVDYHSHHHDEYDWRIDPKYNKDLEYDPRGLIIYILRKYFIDYGNQDVSTYSFPFEGRDDWAKPVTTDVNIFIIIFTYSYICV